jgi:hypothetical protein
MKRQKQILDNNDHNGAGQPAGRILRTTPPRRRPGADGPTPGPPKPLPPPTVPMITIIDSDEAVGILPLSVRLMCTRFSDVAFAAGI